ncbi:zinc finger protein, partial [Clarias magur]
RVFSASRSLCDVLALDPSTDQQPLLCRMSRRKQAKPRSLRVEDNVTEEQHTPGQAAIQS